MDDDVGGMDGSSTHSNPDRSFQLSGVLPTGQLSSVG